MGPDFMAVKKHKKFPTKVPKRTTKFKPFFHPQKYKKVSNTVLQNNFPLKCQFFFVEIGKKGS